MKIKKVHIFDAPPDKVWIAREKRFEDPKKFPELKKIKIISREENGDTIKMKREIELVGDIPKVLEKSIKTDMLKCEEESIYDLKKNTHTWVITSKAYKKLFEGYGTSIYTEFKDKDGKVKTKRTLEFTLKVKVPILGDIAEKFLMSIYEKSLEKDGESIKKMLKIMNSEEEEKESRSTDTDKE